MKISTFSTLIGIIIVSNVLVGTGEYFNDQLQDDLSNITFVDYGNLSKYSYNETEFNSTAEQLEESSSISGAAVAYRTFKNIFFGIPTLVQNILTWASYPIGLVAIITLGLDAIFAIIYILFILQIVSYFMGGGD